MLRLGAHRALRLASITPAPPARMKANDVAQQVIETDSKASSAFSTSAGIKPFDALPGPRSLPLIGSTWLTAKLVDSEELGSYLQKHYGNICVLRKLIGIGDAVVIFDVKDIEMMYRNEGTWPIRLGFYSIAYYRNVLRKDIFGDIHGLLTSQAQPWADFRTKVNPILTPPRTAQQYIASINDVADEFIGRTTEFMHASPAREMPQDYLDELQKWALESIGVIALDTRLGCIDKNPSEESHKLAMYMQDIFAMSQVLDFSPLAPFCRKFNLPIWQRFVKYQDFITDKILALIEEAIRKMERDPSYASKSEAEKSAFEKLRAKGKIVSLVMTLDMMVAGIDAMGRVSAAILYFLAVNKDKQAKLREEVCKALPGTSSNVSKESLVQLQYLRAVIKEALRLAPAVPSGLRIMTKDVVLGGFHIPKGKAVIVPLLYLSMSEQHYKHPKEFKPERWMRSDVESELKTTNPFVCMPFGFGPRSCIGKRLANLEMEVFIAKMIKQFDINWNYGTMQFGTDLLYGVKDPLKLQLTPLKRN